MNSSPATSNRPVVKLLSVAVSLRILSDTAFQLFFPFLSLLAAGVGVTVTVMGQLLAIRSITGLVAPLIGEIAARRGFRPVLQSGLLLIGGGLILFASTSHLFWTVISLLMLGLGSNSFVPNLFAYASAQIPARIRSRGLGTLELSWAIASIAGMYLIGQGFLALGWRQTMIILGVLTIVGSSLIWLLAPLVEQATETRPKATSLRQKLHSYFDWGSHRRSAWAMHLATLFSSFALIHMFGAYGEWLFTGFALDAGQLGSVALAFGVADFICNSLISIFGDRVGPLRTLRVATPAAAAMALLLIWLDNDLMILIGGLLMMRFFVESIFVNSLIVTSNQVPKNRAKMMTISSLFATFGIALANITGPAAFVRFGPAGLAIPTTLGYAIATVLFTQFVRDPKHTEGDNHG